MDVYHDSIFRYVGAVYTSRQNCILLHTLQSQDPSADVLRICQFQHNYMVDTYIKKPIIYADMLGMFKLRTKWNCVIYIHYKVTFLVQM
jgi:hypothetical protein